MPAHSRHSSASDSSAFASQHLAATCKSNSFFVTMLAVLVLTRTAITRRFICFASPWPVALAPPWPPHCFAKHRRNRLQRRRKSEPPTAIPRHAICVRHSALLDWEWLLKPKNYPVDFDATCPLIRGTLRLAIAAPLHRNTSRQLAKATHSS